MEALASRSFRKMGKPLLKNGRPVFHSLASPRGDFNYLHARPYRFNRAPRCGEIEFHGPSALAGGNEILVLARVIENQLHLVASGYDIPTAIYDRAGANSCESKKRPRSGHV
jgi:hypothetical protein